MMRMPRIDRQHVREFCYEISSDREPAYLDVSPSEQDISLDCFMNVEKHIAKAGGSIQYGWRIWEWPNTLIEAEFHAVWRTPDGKLVDTTPAPKDFRRILFLPDASRSYEGRQVDNIRKALYKHPLVAEFIRLWEEQFEIYNRGERAHMHGEMAFKKSEKHRLIAIKKRIVQIQMLLSLCPCGSLLRFHRCCGRDL
jgi:hypothetical protein